MTPRSFRVRGKRRETADTATLDLEVPGEEPFAFAPGQFNMLYCFGIGEVPVSVSGLRKSGALSHTVRAVGAVTRALCGLRRGDVVGVRGPFGSCWPTEEARGRDVVLVAGGIGIAPLRPVLQRLLADRASFAKVVLLYGTRGPEDLLYRRELERWGRRGDVEVRITVDRAARDWGGSVGVVTDAIRKATFAAANARALVCGPEVMMRRAIQELSSLGVPESAIYLSMERNMKCAIGLCGHCQLGPAFVCKDGPVFRYDAIRHLLAIREL